MKQNGYDAFFKAAKSNAKKPSAPQFHLNSPQSKKAKKGLDDFSEQELRKIFKLDQNQTPIHPAKKKKKSSFSMTHVLVASALLAGSSGFILFPDEVSSLLSRVQLQFMTAATAADSAKTTDEKAKEMENTAAETKATDAAKPEGEKQWSEEDVSYFSKLNERNQQLDLREKELGELEQELNKQRAEVESRIQYLETVRRDIAGVLKDRVEVDQEKVKKLVEFYSNMKPAQAAQIISNLNEDLAIGVLSNMKKKNAAEIMNMLEPGKAQSLSEKFAGYTKTE